MPSATIKLFLVHGDAKRLRTAELSNWTGKAVAGPRSELDSVLARDEAANSGVYLLTGTDAQSGQSCVYVGEAECIRDRLRSHLAKDFWNHVVFFVSKDSQAVLRERPSAQQWPYTLVARHRLIEEGTLVAMDDHYVFIRDAEFSSPSAAATVIHGGSANGLLAWKDPAGRTLKDLEAV